MELAESKQCVVGIILPKWLKLGSTDLEKIETRFLAFAFAFRFSAMAPKSFDAAASGASAAEILRARMDEARAQIGGRSQAPSVADSKPDAMEVDVPPSTLDSEMMSEGSFQLVDHLTEITAEDYQMAEQVAETRKNEEDAASLTLSGANPDGYAILQNATKVDLQKSLAELTEAMQQLATKDKPVDQGVSTQPAGEGERY